MSYIEASSEDRINLDDLTDKISEEKENLSKSQQKSDSKHKEKYEQIRQQYLRKVTKEHVEEAIAKAIANGSNQCIIIDDCYLEDYCWRSDVFYDMGIYDELARIVPKGTRIIEYTCSYGRHPGCECRYIVRIRWGHYCLADILDCLCCLCCIGRCGCGIILPDRDL